MPALPPSLGRVLGCCTLAALLAACSNAGDGLGFGPRGTGDVQVLVFLDRDGSGGSSSLDTVVSGVRVGLLVAGTGDTVASGISDSQGLIQLTAVPAGDYRLAVDSATVGDTIGVQDTGPVLQVRPGSTLPGLVRLGYPAASVTEARQLPVGSVVMVSGVILADPGTFSDTTAHLAGVSSAIRLTGAVAVNFPTAPGDSVRVVGTTAARDGQPVLDQARIYVYSIQGGPPAPQPVTTVEASSAGGGALDAGLVRVTGAIISDTSTIAAGFQVTVDDGSGSLEVVVDPRVTSSTGVFVPGKTLAATGVLVPQGTGIWVLKPRVVADFTVQ